MPDLNKEQRAAADFGIVGAGVNVTGPLLVLAGAGTGKTQTLTSRVARLVASGCDPSRILLMTFSRRAARELSHRVTGLLDKASVKSASLDWVGTFHSVAVRVLRANAERLGLEPNFTILDRSDAVDLMGLVRQELVVPDEDERLPHSSVCLDIWSSSVNTCRTLHDTLVEGWPSYVHLEARLRALFVAYFDAKSKQAVIDLDDLLVFWAGAMKDKAFAADLGSAFDHVLIDEYQDTNRLQDEIVHALKPDGYGLTVVGDDAQSIYAFRGAEVDNIVSFPTRFQPPATVVRLESNYRSTVQILDLANAVLADHAGMRKRLYSDKVGSKPTLVSVRDDEEQASYVAARAVAMLADGESLRDQAVLYRASHHAAALELALIHRRIPYVKRGGTKLLDAAHVKDLLAILRWASTPSNHVAGFRVLRLVDGIGSASARSIVDWLPETADVFHSMTDAPCPRRSRPHLRELTAALLNIARASGPASCVEEALAWYAKRAANIFDDWEARRLDLAQLVSISAGHRDLDSFLDELVLDPDDVASTAVSPPLDDDHLVLSSIHAAKGLEWRHVTVLSAVEGAIPSFYAKNDRAVAEELRLLYVAMTRARNTLTVVVPESARIGRETRRMIRTRFLSDASAQLWEAVPVEPNDYVMHKKGDARIDLRKSLRAAVLGEVEDKRD